MRRKFIVAAVMFFTIMLLVACAPSQTSIDKDDSTVATEMPAAELPVWSESSDCESCHTTEAKSTPENDVAYYPHTEVACLTCHTDLDDKLTVAHADYATAKEPTKLKKTSVSRADCLSCHVVEDLRAITTTSTVLTDSKGTIVNPHDLPATEEHTKNIQCSDCHKTHQAPNIVEQAKAACTGCHHEGVYECGTCHE